MAAAAAASVAQTQRNDGVFCIFCRRLDGALVDRLLSAKGRARRDQFQSCVHDVAHTTSPKKWRILNAAAAVVSVGRRNGSKSQRGKYCSHSGGSMDPILDRGGQNFFYNDFKPLIHILR